MNMKKKISNFPLGKNKKIIWIIALVLALGMIIPLALAQDIQYFMEDMEANPSDYYILHNRVEPELTSLIQNFADNFGIQVSDIEIPGKNLIVITFEDDEFGSDYVLPLAVSYAEFGENEGIFSLEIWVTIEEGYLEFTPNTNTEVGAYETNLNVILNHLLNYQSSPIENIEFSVAYARVVEERMPTCAELAPYDWDIYTRDRVYWWGELLEDYCIDNILMGLECTGTDIEYKPYNCVQGCGAGHCIYSVFWLIGEPLAGRMTYPDFYEGLNAWIDMP